MSFSYTKEFQIVTGLKSEKKADPKMALHTFFTPLKYFYSNGLNSKTP